MLVCTAFLRFSRQLRCGRGQQKPPSPIILMPYRTNALHTDGFLGRAGGFRQMHLFYMAVIQMLFVCLFVTEEILYSITAVSDQGS